jgi:hypothetical protein
MRSASSASASALRAGKALDKPSEILYANKIDTEVLQRTVAELPSHTGSLGVCKVNDALTVATNFTGFFLTKNWMEFAPLVIVEMQRHFPDMPLNEIKNFYATAHDEWVDEYCD